MGEKENGTKDPLGAHLGGHLQLWGDRRRKRGDPGGNGGAREVGVVPSLPPLFQGCPTAVPSAPLVSWAGGTLEPAQTPEGPR